MLVDLYGGAAVCLIPEGWTDASQFRQVPDNQEVYLETNGRGSLIIEILQHHEEFGPEFFFKDLANIDTAEESVITLVSTHSGVRLGPNQVVTRTDIEGIHQIDGENICVCMTVFRVPPWDADILVTTHNCTPEIQREIAHTLQFNSTDLFS